MFLEFVRVAHELRPRFILFENVAGLITAKTPDGRAGGVLELVQESFEGIGYACSFRLLNAADFGAPQRRVRLFMLASCDEALPEFPRETHSRDGGDLFSQLLPWMSLGAFIASQPQPDPADVVRPKGKREAALMELEPGTGLRAGGIVEANRPGGHWGYRQDCFLADPELPSRTIRAATTPDWIRVRGGRLRRLTWRECAGLQGFPKEWDFQGGIASRFRQIGNAVQGHIGQALGRALRQAAAYRTLTTPISEQWPVAFRRRVRYTTMEHKVNGHHRAAARRAREA